MFKDYILKGRQRSVMLILLLFMVVVTFAVPAKPGITRLLTLTDGTTVNAMLVGDEFAHFWKGADGKSYQMVAGTDVYQEVNSQDIVQKAQQRRAQANQRRTKRLAQHKVGNVGGLTDQKKGLIILVNFSDVSFQSANNNDLYQLIANQENFTYTINNSSYSFKGSMRDYFYDQSEGQFQLTFDVVGPVTVSNTQAYYGENDPDNNNSDKHPAEMVIEAVRLADPDVNFADYDWDGDGTVEQVYVVYAGKGEADGGGANTIWPHEWDLYSANYYGDGEGPQTLDGKVINTYACGGELNGQTGLIAGIGTMCHEFSHCLGYPDFYDIDYSGGQGMGYWDLMCSGSYNDNGYRPAGYTSYERWVAGWKTPEELLYTQSVSNMAALQTEGGKTYVIYNKGNTNEYYLLENRKKTKWDTSLPGEGLLILHVDYDASVWQSNQPNDDPSHQRMTWIPADNEYQTNMANDPFPYGSVNAFGRNTTPAATLYNDNSDGTKYLDSSIENITKNSDGTISFNFVGLTPPSPDAEVLLYEGLSKSTAVSDGSQAIGTTNQNLDYNNWSELTKIYVGKVSNAYANGGCLKLGNSSASGSMKTGNISLTGTGTLTFYLKQYTGDSGKLNVTVTGATADVTQFTPSANWALCTVNLTNATGTVTITLATSKNRAYVDEITLVGESGGSDPIDPTLAYYQNADGKMGEALKTAMSGIIYNRTEKSYDYLWTAFLTTDVRSDGKIWDMYSNITNYTPVTSGSNYSSEGVCYNREHSFPQSWFGSTAPMYTDLHHIYPTDGYVNGMRSNYPFGETNGEEYMSANGFSKLGLCTYPGYTGKVFEPADEYKGDFARTYFYVVTCYEEKLHDWYTNYSSTDVVNVIDGTTYPALQTWQLQMLMEWAKNDPVSEKEINRNNAVYAIQNNRNPFIDYPGLEEYVWGTMTTTTFSYDNYVQPVHMSFSPSEVTATIGEDFTEPTLTTSPANLTVTYSSSEPSVATVNSSTGEVTLVAAGTTIITATITDNDVYNGASASYTLTVSAPSSSGGEVLLYEGLSKSTAVNDGTQAIDTTNPNLDYNNWSELTKIYVGKVSNAYANGGCLKLGTGSAKGSMKTGNISLTGTGTLTFYLKKYSTDTGRLKVTVTGATADVTEFIPATNWALCTVNLTNATGTVTIQLATTSNRAYVDEITLTANSKLTLSNSGKNENAISTAAASGKKYDVTLADRILYKDGEWNTICLPFNVTLANSPLAGATAKTLVDATMTGTTVSLTFGNAVDELEAGVPYIIKWEGDGTDNIVNPVFNDVTVVNSSETERTIEKADGHVKFIGYYNAFGINPTNNADIYYMTAGSTLKHTGKERTLKACRAYFQFTEAAASHQIVLDFGDVVTGIATTDITDKADVWYDLNGRRLYQKPTRKGLYIYGGRKVVVK